MDAREPGATHNAARLDEDVVKRVFDFWFGAPGAEGTYAERKVWFEKDAAFDAEVAMRLRDDYERAAAGALDAPVASAEGCLALTLLLDQVPRNLFRGHPRSCATDAKARAVAERAIAAGYDRAFDAVRRLFLYLPFEHSEDLRDQDRSVALAESLANPEHLRYALRHREIIARFGRFPHRNVTLGRASTAEELEFLKEPYSSF